MVIPEASGKFSLSGFDMGTSGFAGTDTSASPWSLLLRAQSHRAKQRWSCHFMSKKGDLAVSLY